MGRTAMRNFLKKRLLALESHSDPAPPIGIVLIEVADRAEASTALAWCDGSIVSPPERRRTSVDYSLSGACEVLAGGVCEVHKPEFCVGPVIERLQSLIHE